MEWHPDAQEFFEGYLKQVMALAHAQGDDPEEIVQGLRAHVESELAVEGGGQGTLEALRSVLETLGRPEAVLESPPAMQRDASRTPLSGNTVAPPLPPKARNNFQGRSCLFYAVVAFSLLCLTFIIIVVAGLIFVFGVRTVERVETSNPDIQHACLLISEAQEKYRSNQSDQTDKDGDGISDYGTLQELANGFYVDKDLGDGLAYGCNFVLTLVPSGTEGGPSYRLETQPIDKTQSAYFILEGKNGQSHLEEKSLEEITEVPRNQQVEKADPASEPQKMEYLG